MKITKDSLRAIIKSAKLAVDVEVTTTPTQELHIYTLDDVTLSFAHGEAPVFYGLTFDALGKTFSILNNLEILVSVEGDEGDEESLVVEDESLVTMLNEYLLWRARVIDTVGV